LAVEDQVNEIKESIENLHERIEVYEGKIGQMLHRLQVIDNFDHFMKILDVKLNAFYANMDTLDKKYQSIEEKYADNARRLNEMINECKGVIAQARSCLNERKDFVKNLGAALQELT